MPRRQHKSDQVYKSPAQRKRAGRRLEGKHAREQRALDARRSN